MNCMREQLIRSWAKLLKDISNQACSDLSVGPYWKVEALCKHAQAKWEALDTKCWLKYQQTHDNSNAGAGSIITQIACVTIIHALLASTVARRDKAIMNTLHWSNLIIGFKKSWRGESFGRTLPRLEDHLREKCSVNNSIKGLNKVGPQKINK